MSELPLSRASSQHAALSPSRPYSRNSHDTNSPINEGFRASSPTFGGNSGAAHQRLRSPTPNMALLGLTGLYTDENAKTISSQSSPYDDYYSSDKAPLPLGLANREQTESNPYRLVHRKPAFRRPQADWFKSREKPLDFSVASDIWSEHVDSSRHLLVRHQERYPVKTANSVQTHPDDLVAMSQLSASLITEAPDVNGLDRSMWAYRVAPQPKLRTDISKNGGFMDLGRLDGIGTLANEALAPGYTCTFNLSALSDWPSRSTLVNPPSDLSPAAKLDASARAEALRAVARDIVAFREEQRYTLSEANDLTKESGGSTKQQSLGQKGIDAKSGLAPQTRQALEKAQKLLQWRRHVENELGDKEGKDENDVTESIEYDSDDEPEYNEGNCRESGEKDKNRKGIESSSSLRSKNSLRAKSPQKKTHDSLHSPKLGKQKKDEKYLSLSSRVSSASTTNDSKNQASALYSSAWAEERNDILLRNAAATSKRLQRQLKQHLSGIDNELEKIGVSAQVDLRKELRGIFASVDRDRDTRISKHEFASLLTMGVAKPRLSQPTTRYGYELPEPAAGSSLYVSPFSTVQNILSETSESTVSQSNFGNTIEDSNSIKVSGSETGLVQGHDYRSAFAARLPMSVGLGPLSYVSTRALSREGQMGKGPRFFTSSHIATDFEQADIRAKILEAEAKDYELLRRDQEEQAARRRTKQLLEQVTAKNTDEIVEEEAKLLSALEKGQISGSLNTQAVDLQTLSQMKKANAAQRREIETLTLQTEREEELKKTKMDLLGVDSVDDESSTNA